MYRRCDKCSVIFSGAAWPYNLDCQCGGVLTPVRRRRGEWAVIPREWFGQVTHPRTIKKRNSVSRRTRKET